MVPKEDLNPQSSNLDSDAPPLTNVLPKATVSFRLKMCDYKTITQKLPQTI
jgi:hypothetical protein